MPVQILPYTAQWEGAVRRFNQRMIAGHARADFGIPETAPVPRMPAAVNSENLLAVEDGEVRGGVIVLEHPAWLGGNIETVLNLQSPLSEGIIDPKYAMVAVQLIRFATKRCPYVYIVGMGSEENPLPRLLRASGWTVRSVPFLFKMLNVARCLKELRPLRRSAILRLGASAAAVSGSGWLALSVLQRSAAQSTGYRRAPLACASAADDKMWEGFRTRCSFAVLRDSAILPLYCRKDVSRVQVLRGDAPRGWFSLLVAQMNGHRYFGDLKIATLLDIVCVDAADTPVAAALAVEHAAAAGCDLIVSNQIHQELQNALREAGFLSYSSNYLLGTSKALSDRIRDASVFVTRQDGDGLVNLSA